MRLFATSRQILVAVSRAIPASAVLARQHSQERNS
jgi:hypothetical protein